MNYVEAQKNLADKLTNLSTFWKAQATHWDDIDRQWQVTIKRIREIKKEVQGMR